MISMRFKEGDGLAELGWGRWREASGAGAEEDRASSISLGFTLDKMATAECAPQYWAQHWV